MLLDTADIELLRLVGWFKNMPLLEKKQLAGTAFNADMFSNATLDILQEYGLLSIVPGGRNLCRLKPQGYRLLEDIGYKYPADSKYVSDTKILTRRNKVLPNNTFGGSRFCGIGRDYINTYLCYYLDNPNTQLYFSNEMRMFHNATSKLQCSSSIAYFGKSYESIADVILTKPQEKTGRKNDAVTFYEAYRRTSLPVYLIECSDTGAAQLLILGQENYRMKIAQAALGEQFAIPYQSIKGSDASFSNSSLNNMPVVIGLDMDIRRIRSVFKSAKAVGIDAIAVIALKEQLSAIAKLCSPIKPELFGIDKEDALKALELKLYEPELKAYKTKEGGFIRAENIKTNRKA